MALVFWANVVVTALRNAREFAGVRQGHQGHDDRHGKEESLARARSCWNSALNSEPPSSLE